MSKSGFYTCWRYLSASILFVLILVANHYFNPGDTQSLDLVNTIGYLLEIIYLSGKFGQSRPY